MMTVRMWKAALWLPLCVVILTVRCGDVGAEWPAEFSIYNVMWAPDGSRLAITYAAFPENTLCMFCSPDWAVATVKPDGSEFRLLTREAGRGTWEPPFSRTPWSPDGRHLALVIDNKIYVMNPDGTDRKRVADGRDLMWSPDGASIVFTASDGTVSISTFDGSKKLTFGQGFGGRFSPNGKMVAFFESLWPDNRYVVHVANVDGADARVLGTVEWYAEELVWSPDSTRIAVRSEDDYREDGFIVMGIDGNEATLTLADRDAQWSPNGQQIAYALDPDGPWAGEELWVSYADGTARQQITYGLRVLSTTYGYPKWSPAGDRIAFVSGSGLYVVNFDGTDMNLLAEVAEFVHVFEWSPDGTRLAFLDAELAIPMTPGDLFVVNADGSQMTLLGKAHSFEWSSERSRLAFWSRGREVYIIDTDGSGQIPERPSESPYLRFATPVAAAEPKPPVPATATSMTAASTTTAKPALDYTPRPGPSATVDAAAKNCVYEGNVRADRNYITVTARRMCGGAPEGGEGERILATVTWAAVNGGKDQSCVGTFSAGFAVCYIPPRAILEHSPVAISVEVPGRVLKGTIPVFTGLESVPLVDSGESQTEGLTGGPMPVQDPDHPDCVYDAIVRVDLRFITVTTRHICSISSMGRVIATVHWSKLGDLRDESCTAEFKNGFAICTVDSLVTREANVEIPVTVETPGGVFQTSFLTVQ